MPSLLKLPRYSLAGGQRVDIADMAQTPKAKAELQDMLVLMDAIEQSMARSISESTPLHGLDLNEPESEA
jgi:hypothetical protein